MSFQNLKCGTGSHSVSAAGLSAVAEWPSSPAVVIFHRGQQLRMWSMQQPQTCFSPLNNPHGASTETYLLLLLYSNSAFTPKTTEGFWTEISRVSWGKVCLARRCCGCPSLKASVSFESREGCEPQCRTILTLLSVFMASDLWKELSKKGKLFHSVSPQDILGQREVHFFKTFPKQIWTWCCPASLTTAFFDQQSIIVPRVRKQNNMGDIFFSTILTTPFNIYCC